MKKSVSVAYTVFVVVILLGVIAYFGWDTWQSRESRIVDFVSRTEEYTRRLADSLAEERDVNSEVSIAEGLMTGDPSLVAIQVYSHDDGLRLSVVKPVAGEFSTSPIAETDKFESLMGRLRYHKVSSSMRVADMQGLEAVFVATTLSGAEIRNNLLIILITVVGLFVITLFLILVRPGRTYDTEDDEDSHFSAASSMDGPDDVMSNEDMSFDAPSDDDFSLPDFDEEERLDRNDLMGSGTDIAESISLDEDFSLPDLDDMVLSDTPAAQPAEMIGRLERELERAASFNQDLSVLLFEPGETTENSIRDAFDYSDLVFVLGDGNIAVIELNKDLDTALASTEDFVRGLIDRYGNRKTRAGIASRNGRLISAERLYNEALGALRRTDRDKNIVAFRSDPEKYRQYLRSQEG